MNAQPYVDNGVYYQPHQFQLPLDYAQPDGDLIKVFAREVRLIDEHSTNKPWLVFFQGGPGFAAPRPMGNQGWLKRALKEYRVLLLDQRGTGNSTPITHQTLAHLSAQQQVHYLSHFRADNIVRDAEAIRQQLGVTRWATLGQSFGGFCSLTYLSMFPGSLLRSYITGGIPPLEGHCDQVYQATFERTLDKNKAFFRQFPDAQARCQAIADHLLIQDERLPNGQRLTVEQFQQIGICFGVSDSFLPTYHLLEEAFVEVDGVQRLSYHFLNQVLEQQSCQTNPIYALLHEACYCQGFASNWSAQRVRDQRQDFNYQPGKPFLFTGEMIFPWMFKQYHNLKQLKEAADIIAAKSDWPSLYDPSVLEQNSVPVSCAVYAEDMFVEFDLSRETLRKIPNTHAWITNEYEHNGLRADGERILDRLITMTR
ncbi:alpha/beta fold hydrolase [Vibrio sp. WXL210]|uniref:alpha/beta fold hydrolase n=1 Tax=Vibrio sp. WXL210 TaxID=3450709 RepID=UPI003EC8DD8A